MANYNTLKNAIQEVIKTNGNNEITGQVLQDSLIAMINSLGAGYLFIGVATPETNPGTPDQNVFYIGGAGTYSNFGTAIVIPQGSLCIFAYNGEWVKNTISIANVINDLITGGANNALSAEQGKALKQELNQLDQKLNGITLTEENLKDLATNIESKAIRRNGGYTSSVTAGYKSAKFDVSGYEQVRFLGLVFNNNTEFEKNIGWCFYDINGTAITGSGNMYYKNTSLSTNGLIEYQVHVPSSAKYIGVNMEGSVLTEDDFYIYGQNGVGISEELSKKVDFVGGKNLLNLNAPDLLQDTYINIEGYLEKDSMFVLTGFIPVEEDEDYYISGIALAAEALLTNASACIGFYDETKTYGSLATKFVAGGGFVFHTPVGCKYMRVSLYKPTLEYEPGNFMINKGSERGEYEPYLSKVDGVQIKDSTIKEQKLDNNLKYKISEGLVAHSTIGGERRVAEIASLGDGQYITISDYPKYLKRNACVSFCGYISSLSNDWSVKHGIRTSPTGDRQRYIKITSTSIQVFRYYSSELAISSSVTHGLTFDTYIKCTFAFRNNQCKATISTLKQTKTFDITVEVQPGDTIHTSGDFIECYGNPFVELTNASLTNVKLCSASSDLKLPIWVFGDSYLTLDPVKQFWPWFMIDNGTNNASNVDNDNFAVFALPGITSAGIYPTLESAVKTNAPRYLVWLLGMNDPDNPDYEQETQNPATSVNPDWLEYYNKVVDICKSNGIQLILGTIPNVQYRDNTFKNAIVKGSGYRYIDFAKAVNAETFPSAWYSGCLNTDGVHPTNDGSKVLLSQLLLDFPEILKDI